MIDPFIATEQSLSWSGCGLCHATSAAEISRIFRFQCASQWFPTEISNCRKNVESITKCTSINVCRRHFSYISREPELRYINSIISLILHSRRSQPMESEYDTCTWKAGILRWTKTSRTNNLWNRFYSIRKRILFIYLFYYSNFK